MRKIFSIIFTIILTALAVLTVTTFVPQIPKALQDKFNKGSTIEEKYTKFVVSSRAKNNAQINNLEEFLDDASYENFNKYFKTGSYCNATFSQITEDVTAVRIGSAKVDGRIALILNSGYAIKSVKLNVSEYSSEEQLKVANLVYSPRMNTETVQLDYIQATYDESTDTYTFDNPVTELWLGYPTPSGARVGRFLLHDFSLEIVAI